MGNIRKLGQREFYVCFIPSVQGHPYDFFVDKNFKHILLLNKLDEQTTLVIDPLINSLEILIKNKPVEKVIRQIKLIEGSKVIKYNKKLNEKKPWRFRGYYNCVTQTKLVLNIWSWSLTPKQLYNYLLKDGGVEI